MNTYCQEYDKDGNITRRIRTYRKFAWLPTDIGGWIWLTFYNYEIIKDKEFRKIYTKKSKGNLFNIKYFNIKK